VGRDISVVSVHQRPRSWYDRLAAEAHSIRLSQLGLPLVSYVA